METAEAIARENFDRELLHIAARLGHDHIAVNWALLPEAPVLF